MPPTGGFVAPLASSARRRNAGRNGVARQSGPRGSVGRLGADLPPDGPAADDDRPTPAARKSRQTVRFQRRRSSRVVAMPSQPPSTAGARVSLEDEGAGRQALNVKGSLASFDDRQKPLHSATSNEIPTDEATQPAATGTPSDYPGDGVPSPGLNSQHALSFCTATTSGRTRSMPKPTKVETPGMCLHHSPRERSIRSSLASSSAKEMFRKYVSRSSSKTSKSSASSSMSSSSLSSSTRSFSSSSGALVLRCSPSPEPQQEGPVRRFLTRVWIFFFFAPQTYVTLDCHGVATRVCAYSCGFLGADSPLRKLCIWIVTGPWFDRFILVTILLNSLVMVFQPNNSELPRPTNAATRWTGGFGREGWELDDANFGVFNLVLEWYFVCIFLLESLMKIIAWGAFLGEDVYFRSGWNVLDFVIAVSSFAVLVLDGSSGVSVFRLLRLLRPLRTLRALPGIRLLVNTLLRSLPRLLNVIFLLFFLLFFYALIATNIWAGQMHRRCRLTPTPLLDEEGRWNWPLDTSQERLCGGHYTCRSGTVCGSLYDGVAKLGHEVAQPSLDPSKLRSLDPALNTKAFNFGTQ
eukprot:GHVT01015563.1.p1 GENE.GHVT01015563.1~~GHVT01015563.1.p1  ORF type:complete len:578 (+),score=86.81 GHVT01015563.1:1746-3479(+)